MQQQGDQSGPYAVRPGAPGCVGKPHDPVHHPTHYTSHPSGVECIEITRHMNFNLGQVVKYVWRAGLKRLVDRQDVEDLKKARFYLQDEIDRREREQASAPDA